MHRRISMLNEYRTVDSLVNRIVGTTRFISTLVSLKAGAIVILIALGLAVTKILIS